MSRKQCSECDKYFTGSANLCPICYDNTPKNVNEQDQGLDELERNY